MPNNYFSVLYKHIIQVENKNVGLKCGWGRHKHTIPPPNHAPLPLPPPPPLPTPVDTPMSPMVGVRARSNIT